MKKCHFIAAGSVLLILAGAVPLSLGAQEKLDADSRKFLSEVRYLITKQESKVFLELPPAARSQFIAEFWQRRDPSPETEENEFREAYYWRIEQANKLFHGTPRGWLQDRGRFYILFGPPNERRTNPMGGRPIDATDNPRELTEGTSAATGEKASEVWTYYNLFSGLRKSQAVELQFVDSDGTGNYRLVTNLKQLIPGGIDALLNPDMELTHELYKEESRRANLDLWVLFDFDWEFLKQKVKSADSNLTIRVALPYKRTIFQMEGERLRADVRFVIQIQEASGKILWSSSLDNKLDIALTALEENPDGQWTAEVPVGQRLAKGRYQVYLRLENLSGDQSVEKLLTLKI